MRYTYISQNEIYDIYHLLYHHQYKNTVLHFCGMFAMITHNSPKIDSKTDLMMLSINTSFLSACFIFDYIYQSLPSRFTGRFAIIATGKTTKRTINIVFLSDIVDSIEIKEIRARFASKCK